MDSVDNAHLEAWIKAAGYSRHPFDDRYLYAEDNDQLEEHFTAHTGRFEDYDKPRATIIVGARGSGKTANCIKLEKTLREVPSNFVLVYNASALWEPTDVPAKPTLKCHFHQIIRLGVRQLLNSRANCLQYHVETELRKLDTWCHTFLPQADYRMRLSFLVHKVLEAEYDAFYLLIDERQTSRREPAKMYDLLYPLLDESLFNLPKLYVKLFVPDELSGIVENLRRVAGDWLQVVAVHWSEKELADLLRALLRAAWKPGSYTPRAVELRRLSPLIPDIDQQLVRAVAMNAPVPRELVHLGRILLHHCASRRKFAGPASIVLDDWAGALCEWHQFLAVDRLVKRPVIPVPFSIEFTSYKGTSAEVHFIQPDSIAHHQVPLPYEISDLWAVLWALERFVVHGRRLPTDAPHQEKLRKLELIQDVPGDAAEQVLVGDLLERVGDRLYDHLFMKSGLDHFLEKRIEEAKRLRKEGVEDVRLWLDLRFTRDSMDLERFPWELLRNNGRFLLRTKHFALTRYLHISDNRSPLRLNRPFGLLYIAPRVGLNNLSYDRSRIRRAFRTGSALKWREVDPPSFEKLEQEVTDSIYQAFHYDGHGTFGIPCDVCEKVYPPWATRCAASHLLATSLLDGYLLFEDSYKQADMRPACDVLHALYDLGDGRLQLALVNACKSGTQIAGPAFGGVIPALILAGFPAVVGMLTSIEDKAAGAFAAGFYQTIGAALADQHLSDQQVVRVLLQAMSEGRRRIVRSKKAARRSSWWIPTLNLHCKLGGSDEQRNRSRGPYLSD